MQGDVVEIVAKALHQHEWGDRFQWAKDNEAGHQYWRDTATAMIAALAQNGWAVVPVEPSEAMLESTLDKVGQRVEPYTAPRESGVAIDGDIDEETADYCNVAAKEGFADVYRAMLSAVSAAPSGARPRG